MKKALIVIGVLLLLATVGVIALSGEDNNSSITNTVTQATDPNAQEANEIDQSSSSDVETMSPQNVVTGLGYVDYSEETLASSAGQTRIVFFHAPWCSVCNFFEGQIEEQGVPETVSILKVDFDSETELKEQYGVTVQSTFVLLDTDGNVVETWPFARGLDGIQDLYDAII